MSVLAPEAEPAPPPASRRPERVPRWAVWVGTALLAVLLLSITQQITGFRALTAGNTFRAALQLSIPIALAGLGGLWAERAGVVNIGLEGMMALGTWFGAWGGIEFGPWEGVVLGVLGGAAGGLIHAVATVTFGVDHIVSGVAINILGPGVTAFLTPIAFDGAQNQSPALPDTVPDLTVPVLSDGLTEIADLERFFISDIARVLAGFVTDVSVLVLIGLVLFPMTFWVLWRTPLGLRLRSVGEDPVAAESLGVPVYRMKYLAVIVSGAMAGLGGVTLVYVFAQQFQTGQTNGRGFIGLAAMIFGNWRPGGLVLGAGLFGFADALQAQSDEVAHALLLFVTMLLGVLAVRSVLRHRTVAAVVTAGAAAAIYGWYASSDAIPNEFIPFLPHVATLLVLVFASQRLRMPAADGKPYRRGGR